MAGTEILTPDGVVDIEDIKVGDWVIADDPTTPREIEKRRVLQTFVRETDVLVDLYVDGEVISTTEEHPFWVPDKGWVEAGDLRVRDLLTTEDGVIIDIDWIGKREGDFEVYNFEVEDFHTYFVSDLEVLVHNACEYEKIYKAPQPGKGQKLLNEGFQIEDFSENDLDSYEMNYAYFAKKKLGR